MALTSPGVEVTIIDQSQYLPAPTNSIPLVVFATAQDKANPNGVGIAQGTTAANAGKLFRITSQRDLVTLYGTPFFYETTNGTPIQGYELNEYGLLAAYSALGATNGLYALRADIDLSSLVGSTGRPTGAPDNATYWLNTTSSTWGIYEWNATNQVFELQNPIVITDYENVVSGKPAGYLGQVGDYAVIIAASDDEITGGIQGPQSYSPPTANNAQQFFFKNANNDWVVLGGEDWLKSVPTVVGTKSNPTLTAGNTFTLTIGTGVDLSTATITVAVGGSVSTVAASINALGWEELSASVNSSGRLEIYSSQDHGDGATSKSLVIGSGIGTVLAALGISPGTYYQPILTQRPSANMPLWQTGQEYPRPSGAVWMKIGSSGNGLSSSISVYNSTAQSWVAKTVNYATDDAAAIDALDATGGGAIPQDTIYAQYSYGNSPLQGPVYYWKRLATGPTVVTGATENLMWTGGDITLQVEVTQANNDAWLGPYTVSIDDNSDAEAIAEAWQLANITNTAATVTTDGALQITHSLGGSIRINDCNPTTGVSTGFLDDAGFIPCTLQTVAPGTIKIVGTQGVKYGQPVVTSYVVNPISSSGGGTGLAVGVLSQYGNYQVDSIVSGGTGYSVGDTVTFAASSLGNPGGTNWIAEVTAVSGGGVVTKVTDVNGTGIAANPYEYQLSNWVAFDPIYVANEGAPTNIPANLTNWFYSVADEVDFMVNTVDGWSGYRNQNYSKDGLPLGGSGNTDPNGPIVSPTEPTVNSEGDALQYGDIWIDTSDLELYPLINRWQALKDASGAYTGEDGWVLIDNSDQTSSSGVLFADARWSSNQNTINPANDPIPTIKSLLSSDNLDLDAPSSSLYPTGMLLFNTRRSGYNVKQWRNNYFSSANFPDEASYPVIKSTWVSASGLQANGAAYMGRAAQRAMVVASLRSVIDTNQAIRDEDNNFNLIACPNYVECQPNMVGLNNERGNTGYILGDTPLGLPMDATAIQAWATNAAGATSSGEAGLVTRDTYLGLFYPSGIATDLAGNEVVVPPSHMMLRTFLRNDTIAYPWFAAAGTRRGLIDNALNIGFLDRQTGEFQPVKPNIGIRDTLYTNFINPLVFFTGQGLLNYGNKTSFNSQSALDRTNVARLIAYIRRQLTIAARPFVFEPNDALTREQISGVVESLMVDLVAKRGIYDYLVVCDESNNTPARIDRNELWIDVAIEPVKAAEFIYIPVRILNTGELAGA